VTLLRLKPSPHSMMRTEPAWPRSIVIALPSMLGVGGIRINRPNMLLARLSR
jgi:hypothetical protein